MTERLAYHNLSLIVISVAMFVASIILGIVVDESSAAKLRRANLDGSNVEDLWEGIVANVALDVVDRKIYWFGGGGLYRANLDDTNEEPFFLTLTPFDVGGLIALDTIHGKVYGAVPRGISRANLDGTDAEQILSWRSGYGMRVFALDPVGGKLYWQQSSGAVETGTGIFWANVDGTEVEKLTSRFATIAVDTIGRKLYLGMGTVVRANLDFTNRESLFQCVKFSIGDIAVARDDASHGKIYFHERGSIARANLDCTGKETLIIHERSARHITVDAPGNKMYWLVPGSSTPPKPVVTITATDPNAAEEVMELNDGEFTVMRTRSTRDPLTVQLAVSSSTATKGKDYATLADSIIIPSGESSINIKVVPFDDIEPESEETIVLTLVSDTAYTIGSSSRATITIFDNEWRINRWWTSAGIILEPIEVTWTLPISQQSVYALTIVFEDVLLWSIMDGADVTVRGSTLSGQRVVNLLPQESPGEVMANLGQLAPGSYTLRIDGFDVPLLPTVDKILFKLHNTSGLEKILVASFVADHPEKLLSRAYAVQLDGGSEYIGDIKKLVRYFSPELHYTKSEVFIYPYDVLSTFNQITSSPNFISGATTQALDLSKFKDNIPINPTPAIYASVLEKKDIQLLGPGDANEVAINYWFHYPRSNWGEHGGLNSHEGDWEGLTVFIREQSTGKWVPSRVAFAQHECVRGISSSPLWPGGQQVLWDGVQRNDNSHIVGYVGLGTHATWPAPGISRPVSPLFEEFHEGDGEIFTAMGDQIHYLRRVGDKELLHVVEDPVFHELEGNPPDWLLFPGTWGSPSRIPGVGAPFGPVFLGGGFSKGTRWLNPWKWSQGFPFVFPFNNGLDGFSTQGNVMALKPNAGPNTVIQLTEALGTAISRTLELPPHTAALQFDFRFIRPGDGDTFEVLINGQIVSSLQVIEQISDDFHMTEPIDISIYAGQTVSLEMRLTPMGRPNSEVWLDNLLIYQSGSCGSRGSQAANPLFNGTFRGNVTTTQGDRDFVDTVNATLAVGSPLRGKFSTGDGDTGTISGEATGDTATFNATGDSVCPWSFSGSASLLDDNTLSFDTVGADCNGSFTSTWTLERSEPLN